ncbi:MAG: chorismate synthase [Candidatus Melainabacteria bacterium GWF2_37_15]|nr:MAG: chorismate synthase [Candidatus Melainabacteria bacterium GWF2_37_15]
MQFRFLTAGESHGKCLTAIIEGVPAGFNIDVGNINKALVRRQEGYGRGGRMKIEKDRVIINSGVRHGYTTGAPVTLVIENKDWENWKTTMSVEPVDTEEKKITNVRPGHADLAGIIKYGLDDVRDVLERSSARETAMRVAVGAFVMEILREFGISIESKCEIDTTAIDKAREEGDTLGGMFEVIAKNVPVGLGSHVHWDRRLDGKIAQAIMSIPAIKSVSIGLGEDVARLPGSKVHDEINIDYTRKTNNAGGIEGGMSNGMPIVVKAAMKPIPTLKKPLKSVDIATGKEHIAHYERSDVCALEAASVVGEAMLAIVLIDAFLEKFGGDSKREMKK